jgi:hypothetical protein
MRASSTSTHRRTPTWPISAHPDRGNRPCATCSHTPPGWPIPSPSAGHVPPTRPPPDPDIMLRRLLQRRRAYRHAVGGRGALGAACRSRARLLERHAAVLAAGPGHRHHDEQHSTSRRQHRAEADVTFPIPHAWNYLYDSDPGRTHERTMIDQVTKEGDGAGRRTKPNHSPGPEPCRRAQQAADQRFCRADDGIRTRDPHLGKVVLYQLSHVRAVRRQGYLRALTPTNGRCAGSPADNAGNLSHLHAGRGCRSGTAG